MIFLKFENFFSVMFISLLYFIYSIKIFYAEYFKKYNFYESF